MKKIIELIKNDEVLSKEFLSDLTKDDIFAMVKVMARVPVGEEIKIESLRFTRKNFKTFIVEIDEDEFVADDFKDEVDDLKDLFS